jgi:hypothetical protein
MLNLHVWTIALAVYVAFRLWYNNWRGPLKPAEIDAFMDKAAQSKSAGHNDPAVLRKFLEEDDGREFFMVNLVKIEPGMVAHPVTGESVPGRAMMEVYTKAFMKRLFARGGHPALAARKIGGYVDAWRVSPDPGWSIMGFMRYRSRRDLMILATDPYFGDIHAFKILGTAETFSFPSRPIIMTLAGPRVWVGLVLALAASLVQIGLLIGH